MYTDMRIAADEEQNKHKENRTRLKTNDKEKKYLKNSQRKRNCIQWNEYEFSSETTEARDDGKTQPVFLL